jgi:rubredoxin-NAD+ reductase
MADYKSWECIVCGIIYHEAEGWPDDGIDPGTRWEDVPEDWLCPDCGVGKEDFEMVEVTSPTLVAAPVASQSDEESEAPVEPATPVMAGQVFRKWECVVCGIFYDEADGYPEDGIAPGTLWEDVPEDWLCWDCGVGKEDFELLEGQETIVAAPEAPAAEVDYSLDPIVIVGTGLAGYNLVREVRKLDKKTPVVMITSDDGDFYSKPMLSTGFTKNKSAADLVTTSAEKMAADTSSRIFIYTKVEAIDTDAQTITFGGTTIQYGKLVLAAGAECITIPVAGSAGSRVYTVNDLMDYARFRTATVGVKKVLVIGAGLIGSEYANDLTGAGIKVDAVDPLPTPLATLLPESAGTALKNVLQENGVTFHFGTVVESIEPNGLGVVATLKNGTKIEADIVLSAIGVRARTELATMIGAETNRGIVCDRAMETSVKNVYTLGDCAEVAGHLLYYITPLMVGARALAKTLTGERTEVSYDAMPVAVKTTLCPVVVSPAPRDVEGEWTSEQVAANSVKATFRNPQGELLGFALTGSATSYKDSLTKELPAILK